MLRVKPNTINEYHNDSEQCETLSYYATPTGNRLLREANGVQLTFLQGIHYPVNISTESIQIEDKRFLVLQGDEDGLAVVFGYRLRLQSIDNVLITNINGENLIIDLDSLDGRSYFTKRYNVTILNCTFVESAITFNDVLLRINGSKFMNNSHNPALTLYSSHITFHGSVSFLNNHAISGSALMLIESFVYVNGHCSVQFSNNSAEDVGGAVFIENDSKCFYAMETALTDDSQMQSNRNCTIHFCNNTARNGGDHIYGTSFLSTCQSTASNYSSLGSRLTWQKLFTFEHPTFNNHTHESPQLSLSAVSSRPSRVCLCNDQGRPACADIDHVFVKMEASPGEVVDIPVVLVGSDFGTTTGKIYANTLPKSSLHRTVYSR